MQLFDFSFDIATTPNINRLLAVYFTLKLELIIFTLSQPKKSISVVAYNPIYIDKY